MERFIWLIFAHFIGDIALQTSWQADNKNKYWYVMLSHCIIWTACVSVALQYIGSFAIWKVIFLVIGYGISDEIKLHQPKKPENFLANISRPIMAFNTMCYCLFFIRRRKCF